MKFVEFAGPKGAALWISPGQVTHVQPQPDAGGDSMYGSNNTRTGARVFLSGGGHLDVRQSVDEVVTAFAA